MARTKRKNLAAITAMRKSPPEQVDVEQQLPDSGPDVEVRKQRLVILIPPLPSKQNRSKGKRNAATVELGNGTEQKLAKRRKLMPTEMSLAVTRPAAGSTSHNKNAAIRSRASPAKGSYSIKSVPDKRHPFGPGTRTHRFSLALQHHPSSRFQTQLAVTGRANFLKTRLERIGGLSLWLRSQGLGQFARIFQELKIDESGLVDLTMEALKRIGVTPVGPRRKLIWAIDQICNG